MNNRIERYQKLQRKLTEKIAQAEKLHADTKRFNKEFKNLEGKWWVKLGKITGPRELMETAQIYLGYKCAQPFPDFHLANKAAQLFRMKKRLEKLEHKKAMEMALMPAA